ncbi:MAG: tyrosine-type recombinase/integrase [Gammaproteobacteria bacterium]|nr:tyrosine-type recombinase/integrase [Gammaproteobacteria bacterium]MCW5583969.1 tyrosine-type recombinase/integrase [Gammaproteobacteria bacterium]
MINHDINIYIHAATSDNTRRAYRQDIRHFITWGGKLPTTTDVIVTYLHTHAAKLNARTLARRLIALKNWHVLQGFSDPTNHPLVKKTLTGIKHLHGKPKEKARALAMEELSQMVGYLKSLDTLIAMRNMALLLVGFFGAFRRSELVNIKWEHITFMPEGIEIIIPRSKTDQSGEGQVCAIPYGEDSLCPVTALKNWCEKTDIQSGFIFCAIDRHDKISSLPLSMQSVNLVIKSIAKACQLTHANQFSSHSLRRGFATTASRKGAPFVSIMRHGRWRHEGTVLGYIEEGQRFLENAAKMILIKQ